MEEKTTGTPRPTAHRMLLALGVWGLIGVVALLDFWTPVGLIGAILFTLPLALCAAHGSPRLLSGAAAAAVLLTMAAELWGFDRGDVPFSSSAMLSRCLLVVSLLTLSAFIRVGLKKNQRVAAHVALLGRQSRSLASQDLALATLATAATRDSGTIAEAKKYVAQLENRARELLEAAPDAMIVLDAAGLIVLVNAQAEKLYGYERGELLGRSGEILSPERAHAERPEWRVSLAADPQAGTASGNIELYGLRKDGSEFPAEVLLSPLASHDGPLLIAAVRDVSLRKAAEAHLAQMEARYRGLLEAAPDAMVVVDQAGRIVLLNVQAEKHFGYRRDELLGQPVKNIIPEGFAERLVADGTRSAAEALAQQIGTGIELTGRRKDAGEFPIELMLSPLQSPEGTLVTAAIRDISRRKDAETQLTAMVARRQLAEEALRESEARYRLLIDGIHDHAIFMIDTRGKVVSWNAGAQRIKGYSAAEIIGRNFSCFFLAEDVERGRPEEVLRLAVRNGRHEEQGMRVRKDGSHFLASVTFTALRDAAGNLQGFSEFSRDLSESEEAEARYRGLLEAAPDAMIVVNQGGQIVLLNVQAEKKFGYYRDELVGQPVTNIIPVGFAERLLADGARSAAEALAQQIGTGIELSGRRKDGSEFPLELMLSPLESAEGTLITAAIRDISVRKAAARKLEQMEGRYRGLLEAAPDPMVLLDHAGTIVIVNMQAEKQFGYRRDELVGAQIKQIIPDESMGELLTSVLHSAEPALVEEAPTGVELDGRHKQGGSFPIEVMLSPLRGPEGVLLTMAIRDITTRRHAEAQLMQTMAELNRSNEELGQFAYIASHDLQEPLRMVASYTQLLSKRYKGKLDADADQFIAYAVDGANRMQRLIQDLLAYSRVGTKGRELLEVSSEEALEHALMNLGGAIEDTGALVTHDALPAVLADEGQLVQLFQNLVGNAIKYQSAGTPRIHVSSAKQSEAKWLFSVTDNGLGIESKYFEKIFGMFQRLHGREEFEGTGIGLAICKKIVERHGGSISVESALGRGSTFRFALSESSHQ
jgi:PAS domain S-box-containing protein